MIARTRTTLLVSAAVVVALCAAATSAQAFQKVQRAVRIDSPANVREAPRSTAKRVTGVDYLTPLTRSAMVLPALARRRSADGHHWVKVRLPRRPNGSTGWVREDLVSWRTIDWRIRVSLRSRRAVVWRRGKVVKRIRVVVGNRSTPTPTGNFFVVEHVRLTQSWAPRKWALATSAYSNKLKRFEGGIGQVAMHARGSLGDPMGSAASHGCVRVPDGTAAWLARNIPNGTPFDIMR
jgi:lipoprotein-anchoring transpeptidase ErfK/SrfK